MAKPTGKGKWFWIQMAVVGLLGVKLILAGFGFGRDWLGPLTNPPLASAQQEAKKDEAGTEQEKKAQPGEEAAQEQPAPAQANQAALGPGQLELLRSIEAQKRKLDQREQELERRAQELAQLKGLIDEQMVKLEDLRQAFEAQVAAEEERQNKRIKHLVALYSNMKPKAAAEVIQKMDVELAVDIFRQMRGREAGKILANVAPDKASLISQMLSEDRTVRPLQGKQPEDKKSSQGLGGKAE